MDQVLEAFNQANQWMKRSARPLENARWEYHFQDGRKENVLKYLSAFQNEDGGFGNGIEPDIWLPSSSPMATWAAGQILIEMNVDANHEMVQSLISYLVQTEQVKSGMWPSVLPENNDYPHAPQWTWQEEAQEFWNFNPSIELSAFLIHWSPIESEAAQLGWQTARVAIDHLMTVPKMDMHEIQNFQQFLKIIRPHEYIFNRTMPYPLAEVMEKVLKLAEQTIEQDPSKWGQDYQTLPLDYIDHPEHPLCSRLGRLVEANLQYYVELMSSDGIWNITWSWNEYPEEFAISRRYWQGILTVNRYKILKNFGYLK
ncbi:prenyltransferase/squalene oxidase repeat-containing protein [Alkalibacillus aidingensis]|uniref:hypothetical protein n=1 Tax=Alkalibacillus aidingensis TaxID=2747607 RepID=UPI001661165E|nr:hypothetical protein [Alkalibacillus aidingensis]